MSIDQGVSTSAADMTVDELTKDEQRAILVLRHILEVPGANLMIAVSLIQGEGDGLLCALTCVDEAIDFIKTNIPLDQPPTMDSVLQCLFYLDLLCTGAEGDIEDLPTDTMLRRWSAVLISRCTPKIDSILEDAPSAP